MSLGQHRVNNLAPLKLRNLADVGHEELCVHSSPLPHCLIIVGQLLVLSRAPQMATARECGLVWALEVRSRLSGKRLMNEVRHPSRQRQCRLQSCAAGTSVSS